jgi:hypothetical protein
LITICFVEDGRPNIGKAISLASTAIVRDKIGKTASKFWLSTSGSDVSGLCPARRHERRTPEPIPNRPF